MQAEAAVVAVENPSVERLESRLRVVEWGLGLLLLLALLSGALALSRRGNPEPDVLTGVESFRLVDRAGKLRATINADAEGTRFRLYDGKEERRISFAVDADGNPGIALFDGAGNLRTELTAQEKGGGLALLDENGRKLFSRP